MEKENSKLRSELDFWKNKHIIKTTSNDDNIAPIENTLQIHNESEEEIQIGQEYKEKKIKGVIYMVNGCDVYAQQPDGTIGEHVAILQTLENGKTKIKWNI